MSLVLSDIQVLYVIGMSIGVGLLAVIAVGSWRRG